MGHSSKFVFPLPGRKSKPAPTAPSSGPWTSKAQRILGSSEFNIDAHARPAWETQSNSGISVAVTETTNGDAGHGRRQEGWAASKALDRRWEQESEIIPPTLNRQRDTIGSLVPDGATDGSSLRRRQSSSTITSYYDKANLPLSISQQTSNSAMAKGLPAKAQALLDMDGEFNDVPQGKKARKKPSRLDLSALLQKHRTSKHVHPVASKSQLRHEMITKSVSSVSASPAPTPSPIPQQIDHGIRKKATRESLRESVTHQAPYGSTGRRGSGQDQPTKASTDLYHLYDHYEQRTFADAMDQGFQNGDFYVEPPSARRPPSYPPPPAGQSGKAFLSPFPPNPSRAPNFSKPSPSALTAAELRRAGAGSPSSPVPADCASVSSRHTRTSKASKRTDRSLQEIDLLQNSVLALSSDSEDDYELSSKGSLAVPTLSDGQASPTSPRSPISQTSVGAYDGGQGKPVKRTSFAPHPQNLTGTPQGLAAPQGPKISPRTSSLNSKRSATSSHSLVHETSRLSVGTASSERTVARAQSPGLNTPVAPVKAPRKMRSESQFDFPAPPAHRGSRSASVSRVSEQLHPASPTSVDMCLQSQRSPAATDNGSIRSGASHGSAANGGRRGSAASSIHDGNSGRFMAVTRQEEMLLAALRQKRARMREDIIAEFEEEATREEHHQLSREMTNESMAPAGNMSRQSSRGTMRQEVAALSARPRPQAQTGTVNDKREQLRIVLDPSPYETTLRTPGSEISDFIQLDDSLGSAGLERKDSKASSISSQRSASGRQRASLSAMAAPAPRRPRREGSTSRRNSDQISPKGQNDLPHQILEDPAEDDEVGIPRPDSPISPSDFPAPVSIKNNKQVRLSAVGFYKPSEAGW